MYSLSLNSGLITSSIPWPTSGVTVTIIIVVLKLSGSINITD